MVEQTKSGYNSTKRWLNFASSIMAIVFGSLLIIDKIMAIVIASEYSGAGLWIVSCLFGIGFAIIFIVLGAKTCKAPECSVVGGQVFWGNRDGSNLAIAILSLISTAGTIISIAIDSDVAMLYIALYSVMIVLGITLSALKFVARGLPEVRGGEKQTVTTTTGVYKTPSYIYKNSTPVEKKVEQPAKTFQSDLLNNTINQLKKMRDSELLSEEQYKEAVQKAVIQHFN